MSRCQTISLTLTILCLFSCARQPQKSSEKPTVTIPEWFDNDSLRTTYLYSEGVKIAALADNRMEALPYFEKVLEIDSMHAPTHYQIGDMVVQDEPEKAVRHSVIAYQSDSTNVDYLGLYGYALIGIRDYTKARAVYEKLTKLEPHNNYNHQMLASLYSSSGMPHMALSVLDSAEYKLGRQREFVGQKLNLLRSLKLYDRAINELLVEVANSPREAENYTMLGILYSESKQDSLAEKSFRSALAINPENTQSYLGLATLYQRAGREEEFLQTLKTLFLLDDFSPYDALSIYESDIINDTEFYRRNFFTINSIITSLYLKYSDYRIVSRAYAEHLIYSGELERGLDLYKQISREDNYLPNNDFYMVLGGEEYLGHRDSVMHYLNLAIEHNPHSAELHIRKAYELAKDNSDFDYKEARKLFKKALKLAEGGDDRSDIYEALASLEPNPQKASRYYKKAIKENPNNAMALNNWAYSLIDRPQEYPFALELSRKACELEPKNATYLDTKAWIMFLMGDVAEAKKIMRQAISLDKSGDSTLLLHYGDILAAEGDGFMAEIYYKRALEAGEDAALIEERIAALKE